MPLRSRLRSVWQTLVHAERLDRDLDEELQSAVEILASRFEREGMEPARARQAAERALGPGGLPPVRAAVRESRPGAMVESLAIDLRYAWRRLRAAPHFTALAVATLGLGIGATTAVFSVVHAVLLAPLPYRDSDRLAMVWLDRSMAAPESGYPRAPLSGPDLRDLEEGTHTFEEFAGIWASRTLVLTGAGEPEQLRGAFVTVNFFDVLGVAPALGRTFTTTDSAHGAEPVLIIGWNLFQRRFGGDPSVVGRRIEVGDHPVTLVGVMPKGFRLLLPPEASVPDDLQIFGPFWPDLESGPRQNLLLRVVGRMRPGVTIEQARADVGAMAHGLSQRLGHPRPFSTFALQADDVREIRGPLLAVFGGVALLLVMACVNVAGLLLARAAARGRETALHLALGAGRARLVRQTLAEGLLLTSLGAAVGIALSAATLRAMVVLLPPSLSRLDAARLDVPVLAFCVVVAAAWGVLLSLAPVRQMFRVPVHLLGQGRDATAPLGRRWRTSLTVLQVALSLVLVVVAGLLARGFVEILRIEPGFRAEGRLTFRTLLPRETLLDELQERLAALPGVHGAGAISHLPYDHMPNWAVPFALHTPIPAGAPLADSRAVSPGVLEALGVQLLEGRFFTRNDRHPEHPVAIVDEKLARRLWPDRSAVGRTFHAQLGEMTVVGVVRHVRHRSLLDDLLPQIFVPWAIAQRSPMAFVVHSRGNPVDLVPSIREAASALDRRLPLTDVRLLSDYVDAARSARRFTMLLAAAFAAVAFLLTSVGVYGVIAYAVAQRRHELGVRRALGATGAHLACEVALEGLGWAVAGCVAGLAGAAAAARLLQAQLYAIDPMDPLSYGLGGTLVLLGAAAACAVPAYRAATTDPMVALRSE